MAPQLLTWWSGTLWFWTGAKLSDQITSTYLSNCICAKLRPMAGSPGSDMGMTQVFYSIQLSLRKFWFDSTHGSQWLYKNRFKSTHDSKWISEIWFKFPFTLAVLTTAKASRILIQINSRTIQNLSEPWLESTHDSMVLSIPIFVWHFLGIHLYCWLGMTFFGLLTQVLTSYDLFWAFRLEWLFLADWFESAHDSSNTSETWIDSTYDSSGFPGMDSESTHDSVDPQVLIQIDSWPKMLPDFFQINSWLKRKTFNSKSTHDSTLSHTHVCPGWRAVFWLLVLSEEPPEQWTATWHHAQGTMDGDMTPHPVTRWWNVRFALGRGSALGLPAETVAYLEEGIGLPFCLTNKMPPRGYT